MKPFPLTLLLFTLTSLLMSCENDDNDLPVSSRVMFVHASPDAANLDVRVNGGLLGTNQAYGTASAYLAADAGTANLRIAPAGTGTFPIDILLTLNGSTSYSVYAIDSASKIRAAVLRDDLTGPAGGKAHIRFLHFSPNAPALHLVADTTTLFANRSFNDQSANAGLAAFRAVDAGTVNLRFRVDTTTTLLQVPNLTLAPGKIYTVIARGFAGGTGAQALRAQVIANN